MIIDEIRQGRVEWFLEFINFDLDKISPGDFAKLDMEITLIIQGLFPTDLNKLQRRSYIARDNWRTDILGMDEWDESLDESLNMRFYQDYLKEFLNDMMERIKEVSKSKIPQFITSKTFKSLNVPITIEAGFRIPAKSDDLKDQLIEVTTMTSRPEENLLIYFIYALDGIPLGAFRQCPECGKFFLHTSKRVKMFCSNKCAAKKVSRDRRNKIKANNLKAYERELEEGAIRARKSYEAKIKKTHPKAKIKRRPRKHK